MKMLIFQSFAAKAKTVLPFFRINPKSFNVTLLAIFALAFVTSGCLSPKMYVDPQFRHATLADIKPVAEPKPLVVECEFQANGVDKPSVNNYLRTQVVKVLESAKAFIIDNDNKQNNPARIKIVVNNFGDNSSAKLKGAATGITLGLAGSEVVDNYEMTVIYKSPQGNPVTKTYKHAIHTTIGAHTAPSGLEYVPREYAFKQVVEDMLLNFINDSQKEGLL